MEMALVKMDYEWRWSFSEIRVVGVEGAAIATGLEDWHQIVDYNYYKK